MHPLLREAGHALWTPTYTGLGERRHLASPAVDLETHIRDVLGVLDVEDLSEVVLIGHSYGGLVATGVADRARERVDQLVYLDAFVSEDGEILFDLTQPLARTDASDWLVQSNPIPPDTDPADAAWIEARRHPQPIETFRSPLRLTAGVLTLPCSYVYCLRAAPGDVFGRFAARARQDPDWRYFELDASHSPHITAPEALRDVLMEID